MARLLEAEKRASAGSGNSLSTLGRFNLIMARGEPASVIYKLGR